MEWRPHDRQSEFLALPDSILEALYGGAAGGGKSESLLNLPLVREFHQQPRFKGILFRRTFPELESEIITRSQNQGLYSACGARYTQEKKRWIFPSGAIMQFGHIEYDADVRKYDTAEYNYIAFDELTSFTQYMYLYMFSRCRSSSKNLPAIIRSGTNPGNIGHAWVRERFIEPAKPGTIIKDAVTGLKRIFIQCRAQDNPYLMDNDPQYIARLQGMAEKDRRAKLDGDWYTFSGQAFEDYREEHYPGEPEYAVHVIDPYKIPDWWPRLLAIDWGYTALCYALWGAISPEERLVLYREASWKKAKISEWGSDIARLSQGEEFRDVVICQSASQNRGEEFTVAEQFTKVSGLIPRLSGNVKGSRIAGKLLIQEYLRWRQKPARYNPRGGYDNNVALRILRTYGSDKYKDYVHTFEPQEEELNLPKLHIFRDLVMLRKTLPLCVYDDDKKEDVAEFSGDDPYDTLRYIVGMANEGGWKKVRDEQEYLSQQARIVNDLARDNNWTSYYRKMERLEHIKKVEGKTLIRPVRARARRSYALVH